MRVVFILLVCATSAAAACNPTPPAPTGYVPTPRHVCAEPDQAAPPRSAAEGPDLDVRERYCCGLAQRECSSEPLCTGVHGPSGCDEGAPPCNGDMDFLGCKALSDAVVRDVAARKKLCASSGGKWLSSGAASDHKCQCPSPPDPDGGPAQLGMLTRAGCMTLGQACAAGGGRWEPPKEPRKSVAHYVRRADECVRARTGVTSTWDPDGTRWDGEKGVCNTIMDARLCHVNGREVQEPAEILALVPAPAPGRP